jgi:hypothetical protein
MSIEAMKQAAYEIGAKGAEPTESERLLFEAWMRGHCWKICGTWDGKQYRSPTEINGEVDYHAMHTRQLWAAWRDRAALAQAIEHAEQYNATSDRVLMENAQGDLERVTLVQTGVGIGKAEQAQPVAYRCWNNPKNADGTYGVVRVWISGKPEGDGNEPLYTASPPRQPWVGLTGDEVNEFAAGCHLGNSVQGAIRKAEAKIKEKNT